MSLATQDSDNPDLRDRGFIYWRLLSTDPAAAKEVVLAEKPLISEETDLIEPTLLDELICHISSLASVYHKPPTAFVEGTGGLKRALPSRGMGGSTGKLEPGKTTELIYFFPGVIGFSSFFFKVTMVLLLREVVDPDRSSPSRAP